MAELVVPFRDLLPKQRNIVDEAVRQSESFFIEGPPGSGKTCVSMHIVRTLVGEEVVKPLVLIYNHSLRGYLKSSFDQLGITDNVTILTKDQFYWDLKKQFKIDLNANLKFDEKRKKILNALIYKDIKLSYSIIILDEIQDFTELEWKFLKSLSDRFILLGDFDQRVYSSNLKKDTLLETSNHKVLNKIFRFGEMIASVVQIFSKENKNLKSLVEITNDTVPQFVDCEDTDNEHIEISKIINARKNDGGRIAIISINRDRLDEISDFLTEQDIDHLHVKINKDFDDYDFSSNTPVLITSASAKGLEFSTVIVVGFDKNSRAVFGFKTNGGFEENIYVCLSRATNHLYVLRNPNTVNELQKLEIENNEDDNSDEWWNLD